MKRIAMLTGFAVVIVTFFLIAKVRRGWRNWQKALI